MVEGWTQDVQPGFGEPIGSPNHSGMKQFEVDIMSTIRVAVTGAAGQVAYAMLGRLASGEIFGPKQKIILQLLEISQAMQALEGVAMELGDCSFPTLQDIVVTDDPNKAFRDCNYALLVGSFPRKQGME